MSAPSVRPSGRLRRTATRAWASDRLLALLVALMGPTLAVCAIGLAVDPNVITGAPAWLKPAKFSVSIAIYGATLLWLLTLIDGHRRLVRTIGAVTALALGIEQAIIVGAVVLDTTSHFNVSTPAQTAAWSTMGASIVLVWVMNLLAMILLLRQRLVNRAFAWSLRLGLVASCVGHGSGVPHDHPHHRAARRRRGWARATRRGRPQRRVADGRPGLPIVGWSTIGGDLRAAHFVGLHGLQVLPLVGWLLVLMRVAVAGRGPSQRAGHRCGFELHRRGDSADLAGAAGPGADRARRLDARGAGRDRGRRGRGRRRRGRPRAPAPPGLRRWTPPFSIDAPLTIKRRVRRRGPA